MPKDCVAKPRLEMRFPSTNQVYLRWSPSSLQEGTLANLALNILCLLVLLQLRIRCLWSLVLLAITLRCGFGSLRRMSALPLRDLFVNVRFPWWRSCCCTVARVLCE